MERTTIIGNMGGGETVHGTKCLYTGFRSFWAPNDCQETDNMFYDLRLKTEDFQLGNK